MSTCCKEDLDLVIHLATTSTKGRPNQRGCAACRPEADHDRRLSQPPCPVQDRPAPAGGARGVSVVVTWDDHELEDNCAGGISEDRRPSREDVPAAAPPRTRRISSTCRCAARHCPRSRRCSSIGGWHLAAWPQFDVLDTRQYRTDQPCGDGTKPPCDGELNPRRRCWATSKRPGC